MSGVGQHSIASPTAAVLSCLKIKAFQQRIAQCSVPLYFPPMALPARLPHGRAVPEREAADEAFQRRAARARQVAQHKRTEP